MAEKISLGLRDGSLSMRRRLGRGTARGRASGISSATAKKNTTGITGDVSCDFYHHVEEDLRMMAEGGQEHLPFSISWSRILPKTTMSSIRRVWPSMTVCWTLVKNTASCPTSR